MLYIINIIGKFVLIDSFTFYGFIITHIVYHKAKCFTLVGRYLYYYHIVGQRCKNTTFKMNSVYIITCCIDSFGQTLFTTIVCRCRFALIVKRQFKVAKRQIFLAMGAFEEITVYQCICLLLLTLENQFANILQNGFRRRAVVVVRRSAPEGFFVQLYLLHVSTSKHHCSKVRISHRQCL